MKVGDYVRTDNGCICKVLKYTDISGNDFYVNTDSQYDVIYKSWVVKSSPNIIDLIEVGDYVNGSKVKEINNSSENPIYHFVIVDNASMTYSTIYKNEIRSILTKEQFSQMEYKVGEQ